MDRKAAVAVALVACMGVLAASAGHIKHVAYIMIDGLHAIDLDNFIAEFPNSNIAALMNHGVKYENFYLPAPTDSWPAVATHVTGSTCAQHGVIYEQPYSRFLYPPGSNCTGSPGSPVDYSEDSTDPPTQLVGAGINPDIFPLNKTLGCTPVYPNNWLLVNTMFAVATQAGLKTAWSDKAVQYQFVAGPGNPLDLSDRITDTYFPAVDYLINKKDIPSEMEYDLLHMNAILNWIKGNYANGTSAGSPFNLFGSSFQALNAAQKSADTQVNNLPIANPTNTYLSGGYGDASAIPNDPTKNSKSNPAQNTQIAEYLNANANPDAYFLAEVHSSFEELDDIVGQTVNALKTAGIYEETALYFTSKHGNSPINHTELVRVPPATLTSTIEAGLLSGTIANIDADTGAYVWLTDNSPANIQACVNNLLTPANMELLNTANVLYGASLEALLGSQPDRIPDIFIEPIEGTVYTTSLSKVSDHGGTQETDVHIALIIHNPLLTPGVVTDKVYVPQLTVTSLDLLGLDYTLLEGAKAEGWKPLPGLDFGVLPAVPAEHGGALGEAGQQVASAITSTVDQLGSKLG